jgi:hypothetical protein
MGCSVISQMVKLFKNVPNEEVLGRASNKVFYVNASVCIKRLARTTNYQIVVFCVITCVAGGN